MPLTYVVSGLAAMSLCPELLQADPMITSWMTEESGNYARIYVDRTAEAAGDSVTTWSQGQGTQSSPAYAGVLGISSSPTWIYIRTSGLGHHVMGPWYLDEQDTQLFPNFPANQNAIYRIPRNPTIGEEKTLTGLGAIGYFVDGVAMFDGRDSFSYSSGSGQDATPSMV